MLPIHQQLEKQASESALNIRTGLLNPTPTGIFIHSTPASASAQRQRNFYPTATTYTGPPRRMDNSLKRRLGPGKLQQLEVREPFAVEPWWTPPPITIKENTEVAIAKHREMTTDFDPPLAIYSDGSGINGKVGAAATAPSINTH